jgi:protocatechuate 3,4-dioxygenase beta subunit
VVPGDYPGRTRHFHVNVQPRGRALLTTQLYFPNEKENRGDALYRPELEMKMPRAGEGTFDFVVDV